MTGYPQGETMTGITDEYAMDQMRLVRAYPLVLVKLSRQDCDALSLGTVFWESGDLTSSRGILDLIRDVLRERCNRETLDVVGVFVEDDAILVRCRDNDFQVARGGFEILRIWTIDQMVRQ